MLLVISSIIIIIFTLDKLTRFVVNDNDLSIYFGKKGSGKTSFIAADSLKEYKKGRVRCYSTTNVRGCYTINIDDLDNFVPLPNSVIYIDEIGLLFNNRNWKSFNESKLYFFKMQRHYHCKVKVFSQVYNDMEKKIRDLADNVYIMKRFLRVFCSIRKITKNFDISNNMNEEGDSSSGGKIVDIYKFSGLPHFIFLPRYFSFFDSFEKEEKPYLNSKYIRYSKESKIASSGFNYYPTKIKEKILLIEPLMIAIYDSIYEKILLNIYKLEDKKYKRIN